MMIKKGLMIMSEMLMPFEKQEQLERLKKVKKRSVSIWDIVIGPFLPENI